jgi:hypothetical protein
MGGAEGRDVARCLAAEEHALGSGAVGRGAWTVRRGEGATCLPEMAVRRVSIASDSTEARESQRCRHLACSSHPHIVARMLLPSRREVPAGDGTAYFHPAPRLRRRMDQRARYGAAGAEDDLL